MNVVHSLIVYNTELKNLGQIRKEIERIGSELGVDEGDVYDLSLAATEVVTNTIEHGYHGAQGPIEVEISQQGSDIVLYVRDNAPPFDPTTLEDPDLNLPLEKRPLGGMGVYLAKKVVDDMRYSQSDRWANELALVKKSIIGLQKS